LGATLALDGLDLQVATRDVHGFHGPNGAGKSTTFTAGLDPLMERVFRDCIREERPRGSHILSEVEACCAETTESARPVLQNRGFGATRRGQGTDTTSLLR
jgi:ABC-type multidrug transport system ATPase subunit